MANDLTKSPLIIDTAAVIFAAGTKIKVKSIRWVGAAGTAAGHTLVIEDGAGRVVFSAAATGAYYTEPHFPQEVWDGLEVATIASGVVYIEV